MRCHIIIYRCFASWRRRREAKKTWIHSHAPCTRTAYRVPSTEWARNSDDYDNDDGTRKKEKWSEPERRKQEEEKNERRSKANMCIELEFWFALVHVNDCCNSVCFRSVGFLMFRRRFSASSIWVVGRQRTFRDMTHKIMRMKLKNCQSHSHIKLSLAHTYTLLLALIQNTIAHVRQTFAANIISADIVLGRCEGIRFPSSWWCPFVCVCVCEQEGRLCACNVYVCLGACVRPCVMITLNCICHDYCIFMYRKMIRGHCVAISIVIVIRFDSQHESNKFSIH